MTLQRAANARIRSVCRPLCFPQLGCEFTEGGQSLQLCPLSSSRAPTVAESQLAGNDPKPADGLCRRPGPSPLAPGPHALRVSAERRRSHRPERAVARRETHRQGTASPPPVASPGSPPGPTPRSAQPQAAGPASATPSISSCSALPPLGRVCAQLLAVPRASAELGRDGTCLGSCPE